MPMRIIAGKYRHRHLDYPIDNKGIRPTKDRIREAIFSSFGDINDLTFLDLCAGVGSIGLEAISRGAKKVYFVDNDSLALKYIRKNISALGVDNVEVIAEDASNALIRLKDREIKFDIIYFDPPYESDLYSSILDNVFNNDLLSEKGIFAIESKYPIAINPIWNCSIKEYHYGETTVYVLRK